MTLARQATRRTILMLRCALVAGALAVVLAAAGPIVLGWRSFTVMSGSMEPTIAVGDVVVVSPILPHDARPGEILTFPSPDHKDMLLTHRVRSISPGPRGSLRFVTKGDANTGVERWSVSSKGSVGRVAYRIPKLGLALAPTRTPTGRILLVSVPAALFALLLLREIWMPRKRISGDPA